MPTEESRLSRSARLFDLLQALRRRRRPASAAELAEELGVSLRTVYRDVATLAAVGAPVEGAAGVGYVLRSGVFLPPLMFGEDEADAVILGLRLVADRGDDDLAKAAEDALAKIAAVLPPEREDAVETTGLRVGPGGRRADPSLTAIRHAIQTEERLMLRYVDKKGMTSIRVVWPIAVGFFAYADMLAAWCELRRDFRHFRLDRVEGAESTGERYPRRRRILLGEWRASENIER